MNGVGIGSIILLDHSAQFGIIRDERGRRVRFSLAVLEGGLQSMSEMRFGDRIRFEYKPYSEYDRDLEAQFVWWPFRGDGGLSAPIPTDPRPSSGALGALGPVGFENPSVNRLPGRIRPTIKASKKGSKRPQKPVGKTTSKKATKAAKRSGSADKSRTAGKKAAKKIERKAVSLKKPESKKAAKKATKAAKRSGGADKSRPAGKKAAKKIERKAVSLKKPESKKAAKNATKKK